MYVTIVLQEICKSENSSLQNFSENRYSSLHDHTSCTLLRTYYNFYYTYVCTISYQSPPIIWVCSHSTYVRSLQEDVWLSLTDNLHNAGFSDLVRPYIMLYNYVRTCVFANIGVGLWWWIMFSWLSGYYLPYPFISRIYILWNKHYHNYYHVFSSKFSKRLEFNINRSVSSLYI